MQEKGIEKMTTSPWLFLLSSGAILAACPAVAYFLVFATECGFMFTWFLPIEFVKVNFSMVCLVSIYVLIGITLILFAYVPLSTAFPRVCVGKLPVGYALLVIPCVLLLCGVACFALGRHRALTKKMFMVSNDRADIVALRMYGDYVLCAGVNREKREMDGTIVLYKLEQITDQKWQGEEVGPLVPPKIVPGRGLRAWSHAAEKQEEDNSHNKTRGGDVQ